MEDTVFCISIVVNCKHVVAHCVQKGKTREERKGEFVLLFEGYHPSNCYVISNLRAGVLHFYIE